MKLISILSIAIFLPVIIICIGWLKAKSSQKKQKRRYSNLLPYKTIHDVASNVAEEIVMPLDAFPEEARIAAELVSLFENERPFLDNAIRITDISKLVHTTRSVLSKVLNKRLSKNFNQFVNYYRTREVCNRYVNDRSVPIYDICLQCGFKTVTSFCSAFRTNTGYSPVAWCKDVNNKIAHNLNISIDEYFL
jgi:AraC-like DNA-binding protein